MSKKPPPLLPDDSMYRDAVAAMKRYHEAQAAGESPETVERLRLIAESQFQAVNDYQLRALGRPGGSVH
ncbi:hypothetical protein QLG14_20560 [Pseudomonas sp. V104_10]|uniref:hypothetical protein n=1 Tax=Pseudomonas sp. V104_10 TaxID=3044231 RepID=UPI00249DC2CB|nr:hypothetical protein [Pseudomonas sp. V104_10]MDI3371633.1 hypothetical protein [Pseudomonas sp. V104_10]